MPTLTKVYAGDGTAYEIGGSAAGLTENSARGNNLAPPFPGKSDHYYDFDDGVSVRKRGACYFTDEKIYVPYAPTLYIIAKETVSVGHYACVYCYNDSEYLGYVGFALNTETRVSVKLKDGTNYIRLYINETSMPEDILCVSATELDAFEEYVGADAIKRELVPPMAEPDAIYTSTIQALKHNPVYGAEILLFGDSIPATAAKPNDTATYISQATGANVYNCAVGGASMGERGGAGYYNAWSMHRLADAIASGDWSMQASNINRGYEGDILAHLQSVDYTKIDSIIIMYGFNDGSIDNTDDKYDVSTMGGALRHSIETISVAYPNIKIFPCTMTYSVGAASNTIYAEKSQKIRDIAAEYHLHCINLFDIGINDVTKAHYFNAGDGVHINEAGRRLVAKKVARELF